MKVTVRMVIQVWRNLRFIVPPMTLAVLMAACQAQAPIRTVTAAPVVATAQAAPASLATASDQAFVTWLEQARADARKRGIKPATISQALSDIAPIPRVIELDGRQPEFSNTFTRYLNNSVTEARVRDGRALMQKHAALLNRIEREYGVPGRFLVAFWGLETNFGRVTGDYPVVTALATLAYDGRRGAFFREEMFNALTILDRGHIEYSKMKGSWAGAMGQTQFMPSTFLRYAVDEDRNGHIDVWGSTTDALGSGANYLKSLGWNSERTWGREVRLPTDFDPRLASLDVDARENIKPLSEWAALGVRRADGGPLPSVDVQASLALPAGRKGPAFLLYDNYRVILKWNRSAFYAIAVGHLADRLIGAGGLETKGSEGDPLRRDDIIALQEGLVSLGFLKSADGVMGSGTRQAVRAFQLANGLSPDGYPDRALITAVRNKAGAG
jgi:membrane-bound lytic murein transglycosylase B